MVVRGQGPRPAERQKLSPTLGAATVTFPCMCPCREQNLSESPFPHIVKIISFTSRDQGRPKEALINQKELSKMYSWEVIGTEAVISPVPWFWVGFLPRKC